jgi:glycosyltransferase involved in cell wall biosynthesis
MSSNSSLERISIDDRICLVTSEFGDAGGFGSLGNALLGAVEALTQTGLTVDIIFMSEDEEDVEECKKNLATSSINIISFSELISNANFARARFGDSSASYLILSYIQRTRYRYVLFPDRSAFGFYTSIARRLGLIDVPVITYLVGSNRLLRQIEGGTPELEGYENEMMEQEQVANSDLILSECSLLVSWYESRIGKLARWELICWPLPMWVKSLARQPKSEAPHVGSPGTKKVNLVFFGGQSRLNGFDLFVRTAHDIQNTIPADTWIFGPFQNIDHEFSGNHALRIFSSHTGSINFSAQLPFKRIIEFISDMGEALCILPYRKTWSPFDLTVLDALGVSTISSLDQSVAEITPKIGEPDQSYFVKKLTEDSIGYLQNKGFPPQTRNSGALPWDELISIINSISSEFVGTPKQTDCPLVSICIVHHERPRFLKAALDAIFAQSYPRIEIILVDDGSKTPDAKRYIDDLENSSEKYRFKLKVIRSENRYLGAARNLAASHSSGDFIVFHDDDNISEKNQIETFVSAIIESNADIITCLSYNFSSHENRIHERVIDNFPTGLNSIYSFFSNRFGDANAMFKKACFQEIGGFTEHRGVGWEDWEIFLRAALRGKVIKVAPVPLFNYRVSQDGMLGSGNLAKNFEQIFKLLDQEKPRLNADLIRWANRDLLQIEANNSKIRALKKEPYFDLRQQLLETKLGSEKLSDLFVELSTKLGWHVNVHTIKSTIRESLDIISFQKPPKGFGSVVVPETLIREGEHYLVFEGWGRNKCNEIIIPSGLLYEGVFHQRQSFYKYVRSDLSTYKDRNGVRGALGFRVISAVSSSPKKVLFRTRYFRVKLPHGQILDLFLGREKAKSINIDWIRRYRERIVALPFANWSGTVKVMCQGLEPIYVRDEHGFFVEVMNTNSDYKVFFHESRNGRSEINIISPEDKKLLVLLEPSMLVSTRN